MKLKLHLLKAFLCLMALSVQGAWATSTNKKIVVLSDPHVMASGLLVSEGTAWTSYLEGQRKMVDYSKPLFDEMIEKIKGDKPDLVLITGDLTKAAEAGHDVIMAPTTHCYFDYQQVEDTQFEPSRCGGFIPIERVYSLDPAPDSLSVEARRHILGTQANLWTEYMTNEQMVEYQALPRMSALAEVQWTQPGRKDYKTFLQRLTRFTSLFECYHYTYAKHLWPDRQIPNRWQF